MKINNFNYLVPDILETYQLKIKLLIGINKECK